jgi:predicted transcriptional regulator
MNFGSCYRDRICIISDVLEAAKVEGGTTRTRIMYNANLSHDQMKHYVRILIENHFLYYDLHTQRFKTTEKGLKVIEAYKRIEDMIKTQQLSPTPPLRQRQVQVQRRGGLIEVT